MQATDSSATLVINRQMSCVFALPLLRKLVGPVAVSKHRPSTPFPSRPVTLPSLRHRLGPVFSSAIFVSVKTTRSFALLLAVLDQWTGGSLIPIPACPVYSGLCPPIPAAHCPLHFLLRLPLPPCGHTSVRLSRQLICRFPQPQRFLFELLWSVQSTLWLKSKPYQPRPLAHCHKCLVLHYRTNIPNIQSKNR